MFHADHTKASANVASRSDIIVSTSPNVKDDMTTLLALEADTSPFEG